MLDRVASVSVFKLIQLFVQDFRLGTNSVDAASTHLITAIWQPFSPSVDSQPMYQRIHLCRCRSLSDAGGLLRGASGDVSTARSPSRRASVDAAADLARAAPPPRADVTGGAAPPPADVSIQGRAKGTAQASPTAAAAGGGPSLTKSRSRRRSSFYWKQNASFSARTALPLHVVPRSEPPGEQLPSHESPVGVLSRSVSFSPGSTSGLGRTVSILVGDLLTGDKYGPGPGSRTGSPLPPVPKSALKRTTSMPSGPLPLPRLDPSRPQIDLGRTSPVGEIGPADPLPNLAYTASNPVQNPANLGTNPANVAPDPAPNPASPTPNPAPNPAQNQWPNPGLSGPPVKSQRSGLSHAISRNLSRGATKVQDFKHEYGGFMRPYYFTIQVFFYVSRRSLLANSETGVYFEHMTADREWNRALIEAHVCSDYPSDVRRRSLYRRSLELKSLSGGISPRQNAACRLCPTIRFTAIRKSHPCLILDWFV